MTLAAVVALVASTAVAWALTEAVIGGLPPGPMLVGTVYGAVFATLAVLLMVPIAGVVPAVGPWLPNELLGAVTAIIEGAPATDYLRALGVSLAATVGLIALAVQRFARREL